MNNTKPENQLAYYQEHPPKCLAAFQIESVRLENLEFNDHGVSGVYPNGLVANPNTVFTTKCQRGSDTHTIIAESKHQEIWRHENLVVAEQYFLDCNICHSRNLLFDRFTHGYDAEASRLEGLSLHEIMGNDPSLSMKETVTCTCSHCHHLSFEVFTRFEYPSDLFDEPLFQAMEQEFFSWFTGIGKCKNCSQVTTFIDFECA